MKIDIGLDELEKLAKQFPQAEKIIFDEIEQAMQASLDVIHEQVAGRTPVNTGALRASIAPDVRGQAPHVEGQVSTSLGYGVEVEYGRPPGEPPPVDAIEMWVNRKLGLSGEAGREAAKAIAIAIGLRGTQGAHMFERGFEAGKPIVERIWAGVPASAVRRIEGFLRS